MLATIPRKAIVCLGSILAALAVTACGGADEPATGPGTPAGPAAPSPYLEAISQVVSSIGPSLDVVEGQLAAMDAASREFDTRAEALEEVRQIFFEGAKVLAQEATTLEALEEEVAQISAPKEARRYHELLSEYVGMKKEGVQAAEGWFERPDVLCCVTMALGSWEQQREKADVPKDEFNAEAQRLGYPEIE